MYWLSFADDDRPKGERFLGAIIAPYDEFKLALAWTHVLGINPGGECVGVAIPPEMEHRVSADHIGKLLDMDFINTKLGGAMPMFE